MHNDAFDEHAFALFGQIPPRECDEAAIERALRYPWRRPGRSYLLSSGDEQLLAQLTATERDDAIQQFTRADRTPLLAIGSNAAPAVLRLKFAHFADVSDRTTLVTVGHLHGFDVGAATQPAMYGALPATLFESSSTAVRCAIVWVTPAQLTQLAWSELSYRLGRLDARFVSDDGVGDFDEVLAFVSRFGAFCLEGQPIALAAIPALDRTAVELTQEEVLDAAAALALGPGETAAAFIRTAFADREHLARRMRDTVRPSARAFDVRGWTEWAAG